MTAPDYSIATVCVDVRLIGQLREADVVQPVLLWTLHPAVVEILASKVANESAY